MTLIKPLVSWPVIWSTPGATVPSRSELEERIASAAEKAPTEDPQIQALRDAIAHVKGEYDTVVKQEESRVREAGGRM